MKELGNRASPSKMEKDQAHGVEVDPKKIEETKLTEAEGEICTDGWEEDPGLGFYLGDGVYI